MQTNPEQWALDVQYLAKLADWASGEGFCQIEGLADPDEWCFAKWDQLKPESNGDDYSADALAAALVASILSAVREAMGQNDALIAALAKVMPIRVHDGQDYTEVYFSDGTKHSTHAMTMNPQDWQDIAKAFDALPTPPRGE